MAKIYSIPEEFEATIPQFETSTTLDDRVKREKEWLNELRGWIHANVSNGKYSGEIVRDGVADGYAQYMIISLRPLELMHLPLVDGYQSRWAHRWTAADVKRMVEREKSLRELFSKKN